MILYLLTLINAFEEPEGLVSLNKVLFRRYVEARDPSQPWLVAFVRNGSKKCARCIPYLEQVASRSYGYMFVGTIDQDNEPVLVSDYHVKKNWTIFLFNKDGAKQLTFPCDPQKYYRLLLDSLPNNVLEADPSWIESSKKKPSAILFTSRFKVPHMWRALSGWFKDRLRIGLCTEQEFFEKFKITRTPTVLYLNSSGQYLVRNVQDYKTLRSYLELFRKNQNLPIKPMIQRFFLSSQFKDECKPGLVCVFDTSRSIDSRFQLRETRFTDERLRFFSGSTDLPYKFMKDDEIWIFNGDKTGLNPVTDIQELDDMIKFTLKGSIKWTPISEYEKDEL
ncbi:hypothetical protein M9Y10_008195 [Tritrichomonas musculus]|uniref:Thioredoxin domain-containing protein n=1 Tax=Tritrichomonas musculus TaxID=1915356 RepID=A0ABR2IY97_9EUKA